jgi:hypothetical protein
VNRSSRSESKQRKKNRSSSENKNSDLESSATSPTQKHGHGPRRCEGNTTPSRLFFAIFLFTPKTSSDGGAVWRSGSALEWRGNLQVLSPRSFCSW